MDNQFVLRRANITDINALPQLNEKAFRETFVEDLHIPYPENDLDFYFRSKGSSQWFNNKIVDPQQAVWVVEEKTIGELVAFVIADPCNVDDIPHSDVQSNKDGILNRLSIQRDRRNYGIGQQLMNVILS